MSIESPEREKDPLQAEFVRIREDLKEFMPSRKAVGIAGRLYTFALELNNKVHDMTENPDIANYYDYKDRVFRAKDGSAQHTVLDGLAFLWGLDKNALRKNFAEGDALKQLEALKAGVERELGNMEIYLLDREGKLVRRESRSVNLPSHPKWDNSAVTPLTSGEKTFLEGLMLESEEHKRQPGGSDE